MPPHLTAAAYERPARDWARLPRLREVALDSLPGDTLEGSAVLPAHVRVRYTT